MLMARGCWDDVLKFRQNSCMLGEEVVGVVSLAPDDFGSWYAFRLGAFALES